MAKVLVFESDSQFASDVQTYLEQSGCDVTVVEDGTAGLQEASTNRPDLILLTIELPRMNGFSVCNKLRRSAELKDIPLIIMSSDSSEEVFEQHRRLRTRADEYLHKPAQAAALRAYIEKYVALGTANGAADSLMTDEEFELNEDELESAIELDENELVAEEAVEDHTVAGLSVESSKRIIDEEVDAFTETAFDAILNEGALNEGASSSEAVAQAYQAEQVANSLSEPGVEAAVASMAHSVPTDSRLMARPVSASPRDSAISDARVRELEDELGTAREQNEKLLRENNRLASDIDEATARAKQVTGSAGGSAREILDLRERLNQKERELLDLRDQQMQKDKELLQARDTNLTAERANADLSEKQLDLDKQIAALDRALKSAKADKELAVKRGEDYRRKTERLTEDLQTEREAIAQLHASHEVTLSDLRRAHDAALAEARAQTVLANTRGQEQLAEAHQAHEAELERKRIETDERLAAHERELRQESDEVLGKAYRSHAEALTATKLEFEARLGGVQQQMNALEAEKREVERVLADTQEFLKAEQDKSARAFGKWQEDRACLDRAKDSLAAVLAQIEEIESRSL